MASGWGWGRGWGWGWSWRTGHLPRCPATRSDGLMSMATSLDVADPDSEPKRYSDPSTARRGATLPMSLTASRLRSSSGRSGKPMARPLGCGDCSSGATRASLGTKAVREPSRQPLRGLDPRLRLEADVCHSILSVGICWRRRAVCERRAGVGRNLAQGMCRGGGRAAAAAGESGGEGRSPWTHWLTRLGDNLHTSITRAQRDCKFPSQLMLSPRRSGPKLILVKSPAPTSMSPEMSSVTLTGSTLVNKTLAVAMSMLA